LQVGYQLLIHFFTKLEKFNNVAMSDGRLTFMLPSYLLWHRLPRVWWLPAPLDLVLGSRYYIV